MPCTRWVFALAISLSGTFLCADGGSRHQCWLDGYTPDICCDTVRYGPAGNRACFPTDTGGVLSFEECCITQVSIVNQSRSLLAKAAEFLERGLLEAAEALLRQALTIEPENHDTHFDVALLRARILESSRHPLTSLQLPNLMDAGGIADAPCEFGGAPLARVLSGVVPWQGARIRVPRLLCLAYTAGGRGAARIVLQWELWGQRCDHFVGVGDQRAAWAVRNLFGNAFPMLVWPGDEGRHHIWMKIQFAWRAVAAAVPPLPSDYEWVFLAGDDVFVIVENLRRLLLAQAGFLDGQQTRPLYVGHPLRLADLDFEFNAGGPGYALNRPAVQLLARSLASGSNASDPLCGQSRNTSAEDLMVAFCLKRQGVLPNGPAPDVGGFVFLPFALHHFLLDLSGGLSEVEGYLSYHFNSWVQQLNTTPQWVGGERCCAPHAVSFHEMSPYLSLRVANMLYACRQARESAVAQVRGLLRRLRPLGLTAADDVGWQRTL